jgi:DNA repair protein RecN (Recombination protein N)
MLRSLSVRNIVLIDRLDLEFEGGLTALTGETGAGKSIILDALGLAIGARGDKALVRAGAEQGSAAAGFAAPDGHPALAALAEAGLDAEGGEILLRRTLAADGRSRAFVNDQAASVGMLGSAGGTLIEVHGQHDGRGLLDPRTHRGLLDGAGGHQKALDAVRTTYDAMTAARETRDAALAAHEAAEADRDFLRHAVEDLERLDPRPGEEATLAEERAFLAGAEKSLSDLQDAASMLAGDAGLEDRLSAALASLERAAAKLPAAGADANAGDGPRGVIARAAAALERALIETAEARSAVDDAALRFEVEPGRLEKVEERLFALRAAARKHQTDVASLPELRRALTERLDGVEARGAQLAQAEAALAKAEKDYDAAASALTKARQKTAKALDAAVAAELPPLKLEKARFRTSIEPAGRDGPEGRDRVRFEVATNPGAPFGPLDQIASGGELSRFGLAIKVSLTRSADDITLIFDEVDQGVGGAVADAVGRRLKALSATSQVLVVTHSPQVAARADHHFLIEKSDDGAGGIVTRVRALDGAGREEELARMLAGASVTEEARAAARKLRAADA